MQKLDLTCVDGWKIGLMGACIFLGWTCTLLWMPAFGDKYGRKKFFWIGIVVDLACYTGIMLTHNMWVMVAMWFIMGTMNSFRSNIGYCYLMEMFPKRGQTYATSALNAQEAMIYILGTLYFWKISKHWFYFTSIGYV